MTTQMPSNPGAGNFLLQQYLRAAAAALQAKDTARAFAIGEEAVQRGVEHPNLLCLAAQQHIRRGEIENAYPLFARARELAPRNADILNDLGLCLTRLGRAREALPVFDAALRQTPGSAPLYFHKALAFEQLGQLDQERRALERVVAIEPRHYEALNLLALLAADRNDDKVTREYAGRSLILSPGEVLPRIALATVDIAARDFPAARGHLDPILRDQRLDVENRAVAQILMGDVLDGEGNFADAFRAYAAAKELLKAHYAPAFERRAAEPFRSTLARLKDYFDTASPDFWQAKKSGALVGTPRTHVFLVGFLRSGTTLLGQVLAGHPDVELMHERDCLVDAVRDFIVPADGLDRLAAMPDAELEPYRQSYWRMAEEFGYAAERGVFVDKAPLATSLLPIVAKLFPDAKVLFAIRDPRDVVLSCFRRRFSMTAEKFDMLSLADTAACYAAVMELGALYRRKLGQDICDARHEDVVTDFEAQTRRICEFLGIAWNEQMADFASRARSSNIDIPDSAQLARGLSRDSAGKWRGYRKELTPVLPLLAPWCAHFGYPEN